MPDLTAKDRAFLDENFKRFGLAWSGGLAALEKDFEIQARIKWDRYELQLTTRATPRIRFIHNVNKVHGGMYDDGRPQLPNAPELNADELSQLDRVFHTLGELWMLEPLNNVCEIYDLTGGVVGLKGDRTLSTRRLDDLAVLFFSDPHGIGDYFCVSVDLQTEEIREALWVDLPMSPGHLLTSQERNFLDRGLRENGNFGVYGNVTRGLRALVTGFETRINIREDSYSFFVVPVDGYGHWLNFAMDATTGEIGDCAAGHYVPAPPPDDDREPSPDTGGAPFEDGEMPI